VPHLLKTVSGQFPSRLSPIQATEVDSGSNSDNGLSSDPLHLESNSAAAPKVTWVLLGTFWDNDGDRATVYLPPFPEQPLSEIPFF
jgi:hypothetical protein